MTINRNIAFDLDGTLITCKSRQVAALRIVADFSSDELERYWFLKRGGQNNLEALTSLGVSLPEAKIISHKWQEIIENPLLLNFDTLFEDSLSILNSLINANYTLHLITARQHKNYLIIQLKNIGIHGLFKSIFTVNPHHPIGEKSHVLRHLNPVFFVGDSETDFFAARMAYKPFKIVSTGQRSEDFLKKIGVDPYINLTEALSPIINESH